MNKVQYSDVLQFLNGLSIVGRSQLFMDCISTVAKFSQSRAPVVLVGETGTGKDALARALHYLGPRASKPFVPVNCGGLPMHVFENELFGHRQGAYTDARSNQTGLVEQAEGGTLFLDEVDALGLGAQASLLRFTQDRSYRRLGDDRMRVSDVNLISATNIDLLADIAVQPFQLFL